VKTESQPTAKHTQNPASDFKTPANQNSVKKDQGIKGEVVLQYANGMQVLRQTVLIRGLK